MCRFISCPACAVDEACPRCEQINADIEYVHDAIIISDGFIDESSFMEALDDQLIGMGSIEIISHG